MFRRKNKNVRKMPWNQLYDDVSHWSKRSSLHCSHSAHVFIHCFFFFSLTALLLLRTILAFNFNPPHLLVICNFIFNFSDQRRTNLFRFCFSIITLWHDCLRTTILAWCHFNKTHITKYSQQLNLRTLYYRSSSFTVHLLRPLFHCFYPFCHTSLKLASKKHASKKRKHTRKKETTKTHSVKNRKTIASKKSWEKKTLKNHTEKVPPKNVTEKSHRKISLKNHTEKSQKNITLKNRTAKWKYNTSKIAQKNRTKKTLKKKNSPRNTIEHYSEENFTRVNFTIPLGNNDVLYF